MSERSSHLVGIAKRLQSAVRRKPRAFDIPWNDMWTIEDEDEFNRKLAEEFPFLRSTGQLSTSELGATDEVLAWATAEIKRLSAYPRCDENDVAKLLLLFSHFDWANNLWPELALIPEIVGDGLLDVLCAIIRVPYKNLTVRLRRSAIFRNDGIARIYRNAERHEWTSISSARAHLEHLLYRKIPAQALRILWNFDRQMLIRVLDDVDDIFSMSEAVDVFEPMDALELAARSNNIVFKFLAFDKSLRAQGQVVVYCPELWGFILSEIALDVPEWRRWMAVVNAYPARYPQLQTTMGEVLCTISIEAVVASLEAVKLWVGDVRSREVLAYAFRTIYVKADSERKTLIWETAFRIWKEWDFEAKEERTSLFRAAFSALDYAVVSYIVDILGPKEAQVVIEQLGQASARSFAWWASEAEATSERFRLLSRYQPWAHALTCVDATKNRLLDGDVYQPPWEDGSLYRSIRFDVRERTF